MSRSHIFTRPTLIFPTWKGLGRTFSGRWDVRRGNSFQLRVVWRRKRHTPPFNSKLWRRQSEHFLGYTRSCHKSTTASPGSERLPHESFSEKRRGWNKWYIVLFTRAASCVLSPSPAAVAAAVKSWPCYHGCNGSQSRRRSTLLLCFLKHPLAFVI